MGISFAFAWEEQLIMFLQRFMTGFAVKLAALITEFGDAVMLVGVAGLLYWSLDKKLGKRLALSISLVCIVNPCIKSSVKRLRPYMANADIKCLKPVTNDGDIMDVVSQGFSFPSGHSCNSFTIYGTIAAYKKKLILSVLMILLILAVGASRFVLGVHYPTDVLAGWAVGGICAPLCCLLEKRLGRYRMYILFDIVALAGFLIARTNEFYTGYGLLLGATCGIMFEEKYVDFKECRGIVAVMARTAGGIALYFVLNTLLKMPFSSEFLASGTMLAFAVRAARYAVTSFALIGLYPMVFRLFEKKS